MRADDPGHRLTQRLVEREPRAASGEVTLDPEAGPGIELRFDRRPSASRLQAERLAREIDRA